MKQIEKILKHNVSEVIKEESLRKELTTGKKIRVKFGIDPTAPELHLGHAIPLLKLKEFQDFGHQIVLIIGDFTGTIGDPSARKEARKVLTIGEVKNNAKDYLNQIGRIINLKKTEIHQNSEWYDKKDTLFIFELTSKVTIQRTLARDDFKKRLAEDRDVNMLETIYPLFQAYDSVAIKSDLEIGGTDQKFNLLMGRRIQKRYGQKPQDIMMLPLLEGLDGMHKMSKSYGNNIAFNEDPKNMFGKIMSIPDDLIIKYFRCLTDLEEFEIKEIKKAIMMGENPKDFKLHLATEIVTRFHDKEEAGKARERFNLQFAKKEIPFDIPEKSFELGVCENLPQMLVDLKLVGSKSEAKRLVGEGAVKVDSAKIEDPNAPICVHKGMVIQVGKRRFLRIRG